MKRKAFWLLSCTSLLVVLVSCTNQSTTPEVTSTQSQPSPSPITNSLSGRVGADNKVLVVKIDDTKFARPQIGLKEADLVYIEQVEGGVTRLAAVYSSTIPPRIGPVRSARISDIELLAQFGKVIFSFSGAQKKLRPVIDSANVFNLGAEHEGPLVYSREKDRNAPWNMILNTDALFERVTKRNLDVAQSKNMGWNFSEKTNLGEPVISAVMKWPGAKYSITWSEEESGWLLEQSGTPKLDASGLQILPSTFVAQVVNITNSEYGDKFGEITPLVTTVGNGPAYIFRDGRVIEGTWLRPAAESGTTFRNKSGEEIAFKAGQIWFALVASAPEITYPQAPSESPSASPSATK